MSDFDEMLRVVRRNVHAVVVMLDTCHAGALGIPAARVVSADEMARQMTAGEGFFLLAATKPGEESKEQSSLAHGAFTYAVLEGLRGSADADADGVLTVSELFGYVARRVPTLTQGRQHPYNKMEGTDFTLLRVAAGGAMATPVLPAAPPTEAGPRRDNVIGVMEFQNLRQDAAYDWISKALRLAFNTELSKVQALRVYSPELIDRTAHARGTDPLYTARELGIGRLLTGAYYVSDNKLRIDARIVDATTGVNEASDSVEGELDQFFDLQKKLVLSILRRLRVQVSPEEGAVDPDGDQHRRRRLSSAARIRGHRRALAARRAHPPQARAALGARPLARPPRRAPQPPGLRRRADPRGRGGGAAPSSSAIARRWRPRTSTRSPRSTCRSPTASSPPCAATSPPPTTSPSISRTLQ